VSIPVSHDAAIVARLVAGKRVREGRVGVALATVSCVGVGVTIISACSVRVGGAAGLGALGSGGR
jgi:hypothetical protein